MSLGRRLAGSLCRRWANHAPKVQLYLMTKATECPFPPKIVIGAVAAFDPLRTLARGCLRQNWSRREGLLQFFIHAQIQATGWAVRASARSDTASSTASLAC